jgi:hypothetical protein
MIVKPITTGEIGVEFVVSGRGNLSSVFSGCGVPLIVTRRFLAAGVGFVIDNVGVAMASCVSLVSVDLVTADGDGEESSMS